MTNLHALHEQALWETEGTRRAVLRYREAALHKSPHELPGGRLLLRECVPPLVAAIKAGQAEAQAALGTKGGGRSALWWWPLMQMDAEELAVITVCTAMACVGTPNGSITPGKALDVCKMIARVSQEQLQFNDWVAAQEKANKEAKAARKADPAAEPRKDLLAALRARHPDVDRRTWAVWRRKLEVGSVAAWSEPIRLSFGGWLLDALAGSSGGRFKLALRNISGGRTEAYVALSPETEALLRDAEARAEVARPLRMPMLIPPLPWKYATSAAPAP